MGTSSARRGPTTRLWRSAKGAATRYLSPAAGGQVTAREVVARYLAALEETPGQGEPLAAWRFTRKVGQELGAFWQAVQARGWQAALADHGLASLALESLEMLAHGVSGVLAGNGGGLEEAVVRTSLALVVRPALASEDRADPAQMVRQFLATALYLRCALDLGESLEAAAGGYGRLREGLKRMNALIEAAASEVSASSEIPATSTHWQGLAGWTWVTACMTTLMTKLKEGEPAGWTLR
jgi:hypothetical protein